MSMDLVSIIVSVYNIDEYIDKCIQSIVNQTFNNIEIILVDDGSTDNSAVICDKWAKFDNRVIVIHKDNGGLSSARNEGIKKAKGEYIMFIDGDDYIEHNMIERLFTSLVDTNSDLAMCNFDYVIPNGQLIKNEYIIKNMIFDNTDKYTCLYTNKYYYYVVSWNKLYKKILFSDLEFPYGRIHEDEFVIHHILKKCNKICTISDTLYHYVQRNISIMHKPSLKSYIDSVDAFLNRCQFAVSINNKELKRYSAIAAYTYFFECLKYKSSYTLVSRHAHQISYYLGFDLHVIKLYLFYILFLLQNWLVYKNKE